MKVVSRFCKDPSETVPISVPKNYLRIIPELKEFYDPFLDQQSVLPINIVKNDITIFNDRLRSQKGHFVAKMKELDLQHRQARSFQENHFQALLRETNDKLDLEISKVTTLDDAFSAYRKESEEQIEDLRDSIALKRLDGFRQKLVNETRLNHEIKVRKDDAKNFEVRLNRQAEEHISNNKIRNQVHQTMTLVLCKVEERVISQREQDLNQKLASDGNRCCAPDSTEKTLTTKNPIQQAAAIVNTTSASRLSGSICVQSIRDHVSDQKRRMKRIRMILKTFKPISKKDTQSDPIMVCTLDTAKEYCVALKSDGNSRNELHDMTAQQNGDSLGYVEEAQTVGTELLPKENCIVNDSLAVEFDKEEMQINFSTIQSEIESAHTQIDMLLFREAELVQEVNMLDQEKQDTRAILSSIIDSYESSSRAIPVPDGLTTTCNAMLSRIQQDVKQGSSLWKLNKKEECFDLYMSTCQECCKSLLQLTHDTSVSEASKVEFRAAESNGREAIRTCLRQSQSGGKAKSAVGLRKWIDSCQQVTGSILQTPVQVERASLRPENCIEFISKLKQIVGDSNVAAESRTVTIADSKSIMNFEPKSQFERSKSVVSFLEQDDDDTPQQKSQSKSLKGSKSKDVGVKQQDNVNLKQLREKDNKIRKLEEQVKKLNEQLATAMATTAETSNTSLITLQRQMQKLETTSKKQSDDGEKKAARDKARFEADIAQMTTRAQTAEDQAQKLSIQLETLRNDTSLIDDMQAQISALQLKASEGERVAGELITAQTRLTEVEELYKQEMRMRKKFWNMLEDMKGKIRVCSRCRPMTRNESDKGCQSCVQFIDTATIDIIGAGARGKNKTFSFDSSFSANSSQEAVFEDCRHLVQSCIDGFNVCIFAYGQTGSGKTFTMTGSDTLPGLTPRAVREIFSLTAPMIASNKAEVTIETYFVELYNDILVDLYFKLDNLNDRQALADPPKIEIKVDPVTKIVVLKNTVMKHVTSDAELMSLFRRANDLRHTGATKMNAASSRSHSVFAIQVVVRDRTTNKVSVGKLSLVDLAGSERADKTGASGERLAEAQSINLSLSALGDVINALSTNEKFIPYRNNKLTQLMQDSLGGNAKTLMFVNISPADYNMDETVSALNYASRVKLITNQASKNSESTEIARLKDIIRRLMAGQVIDDDDGPNNSNNEQKQSIDNV